MQLPDLLFVVGLVSAAISSMIFVISNLETMRIGMSRHTLAAILQVAGLVAILLAWVMVRGLHAIQ